MKLAIELTEQQAQRLREGASRLGVEPGLLALAAVADLTTSEGPHFDAPPSAFSRRTRSCIVASRDPISVYPWLEKRSL